MDNRAQLRNFCERPATQTGTADAKADGWAKSFDALQDAVGAALRQIDEKDYPASLRADGVADVMKIGLAYFGKRVELSVG